MNTIKTEMCRYIEADLRCPYKNCHFAHSHHELQPRIRSVNHKTVLCKNFFTLAGCKYGSRCDFIHPEVDNKPLVKIIGFQLKKMEDKTLKFRDLMDASFLFK